MIDFEVGARPSRPLSIAIRDEQDNPVNALGYESITVEILDTNDDLVDMTGTSLTEISAGVGIFTLSLPKNRTLFPETGKYLLRMVLASSNGARDITRTAEIRVRDFGRNN